jgi:hypothetical protein
MVDYSLPGCDVLQKDLLPPFSGYKSVTPLSLVDHDRVRVNRLAPS